MPRDRESSGRTTYAHKWAYDPNWRDKCQGWKVIEVGGYERLVACDATHAHRQVLCTDSDGKAGTWPVNVPHLHGKVAWNNLCLAGKELSTEHESIAARKRAEGRRRSVPDTKNPHSALIGAMADLMNLGLPVAPQVEELVRQAREQETGTFMDPKNRVVLLPGDDLTAGGDDPT